MKKIKMLVFIVLIVCLAGMVTTAPILAQEQTEQPVNSYYVWYVTLASLAGAVVSGLLGWFEAKPKEAFDGRKFGATVLRGALAAAIVGTTCSLTTALIGIPGIAAAFLTGAGVDIVGKRMVGTAATNT